MRQLEKAYQNFNKYVSTFNQNNAKVKLKITHTYRNSQQLIDLAGDFIQKNTLQIRKSLISNKSIEKTKIK